jgi:WD40 associated region in TFIID subunit, NTD2 domain
MSLASQLLDAGPGVRENVLFHVVAANDAGRYKEEFDRLARWVDNSLDLYRVQADTLLRPLIIRPC